MSVANPWHTRPITQSPTPTGLHSRKSPSNDNAIPYIPNGDAFQSEGMSVANPWYTRPITQSPTPTGLHSRKSPSNDNAIPYIPNGDAFQSEGMSVANPWYTRPITQSPTPTGLRSPAYTRASTNDAFVPPNPKLLLRTTSIDASRVSCTIGNPSASGSNVVILALPEIKPSFIIINE
jgi:hypothetical protein